MHTGEHVPKMPRLFSTLAILVVAAASAYGAMDQKLIDDAIASRDRGEFGKATQMLQEVLEQTSATATAEERRQVEFEIERIRRIRMDYTVTREDLLKQIRDRVPDFADEELDAFEREGKLDVQNIDGRKLYVNSSRSNLFMREAALRQRWEGRKPDTTMRRLFDHMTAAKAAAAHTRDTIMLPQDYQVTYTLVVKPNAAPEGETIRCWLPFVRAIPSQSDMRILHSVPAEHTLAQPEAPHRTAYLEQVAVKDEPTTFQLGFVYRCWTRVNTPDPARVLPYRTDAPEFAYYTAERRPHIDFSNDELKKVAASLTADGQTNPLILARRAYDWVARNCIYQYAREYSTLDNISAYTATRRAGDCGQHGMLFIALCRMCGVPARWATGWEAFDGTGGMHDWTEFFVEPYGWLPADPDMAVLALNHGDGQLDTTQTQELVDWMFGSMDHFRLTVNGDYGMPLDPPKTDFRSETVDFQRGEVEAGGRNLYFDKWSYRMELSPISRAEAERFLTAGPARPATDDSQTTAAATAD